MISYLDTNNENYYLKPLLLTIQSALKMPQPTGLRDIIPQEKRISHSQRKLPKALLALFAVCQLAFGFNFGFAKLINRKFQTIVSVITLSSACCSLISFFLMIFYFIQGIELYWAIVNLVQYVVTLFVLFSAKYSISDFLADLISTYKKSIDGFKDDSSRHLWSYLFFTFAYYITFHIVYLSFYAKNNPSIINIILVSFSHLPACAIEFIPALNYLLFYHVYARMKELKRDMKRQEINLEQLQTLYTTVADKFEIFRKKYDTISVCGYVSDSLKWILVILKHLTNLKESIPLMMLVFSYIWALQITMQICVPAVFAEMISVQTDAMKMILRERLLEETDERQALKTSRVLEYMEARPLLRKAWRLVPVDLQLPVTMLSMSATYLIVIVQFLHLYD